MEIQDAEKAIEKILADLEKEYDSYIESISIDDTEVTGHGDERPMILRRVCIELKQKPGTRWRYGDL